MAQMGYGYGSEFQLLRFLGHHRNALEMAIQQNINSDNSVFYWFDFDFANREKIITGDSEMVGLSFLKRCNLIPENNVEKVLNIVKSYKWSFDRWQYWDAVFINNGVLYFVEAKAHKDEMNSGKKEHGGTNSAAIQDFMKAQFGDIVTDKWLREFYQLANRISTCKLLNDNGIPCKLVNIFFIDGYKDRKHNICKDSKKEDYDLALKIEYETLGLTEDIRDKYIVDVFIDANPE